MPAIEYPKDTRVECEKEVSDEIVRNTKEYIDSLIKQNKEHMKKLQYLEAFRRWISGSEGTAKK